MSSDPFIGEISMFAGNYAPEGWAFCNGQLMDIGQNSALFSILGTIYGGDGIRTFALPDLRGRAPVHAGQAPGTDRVGLGDNNHSWSEPVVKAEGGKSSAHLLPFLGVNFIIALEGIYPAHS
ncbi:MAG: tail fiber protein [Caldilineaceae bacterium]|nr:tail fiber protein [Caldilineaceae bacterium]MBP8110143.1 tail fiber protein [Caldilineaceae bacterium]MBP8125624.1 tail fiber protein [Caldilineaceae bacterium]MBP9074666.1 tail fiber protein [Caldilineaceae bacterium]